MDFVPLCVYKVARFIYNKYNGVWSWTDLKTTIKQREKLKEMRGKNTNHTNNAHKKRGEREKSTVEKVIIIMIMQSKISV